MKFKIGELCIGCRFVCDTHRNGAECDINGHAADGGVFYSVTEKRGFVIDGPAYYVGWSDGTYSWVAEYNLRKKPPKEKPAGKQLGSWDKIEKACGWNPTKKQKVPRC